MRANKVLIIPLSLCAVSLALATAKAGAEPRSAARVPEVQRAEAKARAYYHFTLAHMYEEQAGPFRNSQLLRRAIDEYREALTYDPNSTEIVVALAEAYRRAGRIREAVVETRQLVEADPDNLAAHRLLARIYYQTLGEPDTTNPPEETLKLAIAEFQEIVRLAPEDIDSLVTLGRLYRKANDLKSAEEVLQEVLAAEPQSEPALALLASVYAEQGEHEKAAALLQQAAADAHSPTLQGKLGQVYEDQGEDEKAIAAYRDALSLNPENSALRQRLAAVLLRNDQVPEALAEYEALAQANPSDAETQLRLSQIYRHEGRYDEAWVALEAAKKEAFDSLEIGYNEALLYEAQGNFDGAIAVLSEMLSRMTRGTGVYNEQEKRSRSIILEYLGGLYRREENFSEAVEVFKLMLPLDEVGARRGYAQLGETYRQARQLDEAVAAVRQGLERFPGERDLEIQLASLLSDQGEVEEAARRLRALLAGSPDEPEQSDREVYLSLVQIYERHKRWVEAEAALKKAEELSLSESQLELVYFLRGALFERQKKYDRAEEEFRKVLELNPDSAITLNYLGYMFADQNTKLEEAVKLLERAIELEPYNGAYLDSLGWAYYRLDRLEEAEVYLERALERVSRDPTIHDHLGDLYYKLGRLRLAEKSWERSREEWKRTPPAEFDSEVYTALESKLQQLRLRLAQETQKQKKAEQ